MKESSSIAYTVVKRMLKRLASCTPSASALNGVTNNGEATLPTFAHLDWFQSSSIHIHAPEGATPKDGPSAGITMTCSLLSLALQMPIASNIAMTGEITLTGAILPVGGIKEKILAAKRAHVTDLILPIQNQADVDELMKNQPDIMTDLNVFFVSHYEQAIPIVFPSLTSVVDVMMKQYPSVMSSSPLSRLTPNYNTTPMQPQVQLKKQQD
jgi:ATP-dependent Lon protease